MGAAGLAGRLEELGRPHRQCAFLTQPVSRRFGAGLLRDIASYGLIVLSAVEGIFLSDLVISELLPRVLEHHAGLPNLLLVTLLAVPEGLFLALPLAILIAVYLVLLRRREASEFTVLAGMGYSGRALVAAALLVGGAGFGLSGFLTGYVEPNAHYLLERTFTEITLEGFRSGEIGAGKFYEIGDLAVFASRGRLGDAASGVFIHQRLGPDRNRIVMASRALGLAAAGGSHKGIVLEDATVLDFDLGGRGGQNSGQTAADLADCATCGGGQHLSPLNMARLSELFVGMPSLQLPEMNPRGKNTEELTTPELLGNPGSGNAGAVLGKRLLRAVLCFLAPLLALLAVALTRPRTFLLALPAAAGVVLAGSFFGPNAIDFLAPAGLGVIAGVTLLTAAAIAVATTALIGRFEAGSIGPARVRL